MLTPNLSLHIPLISRLLRSCSLLVLTIACSGCLAAAIVGGGTAAGNAVMDQRSLGSQVDDVTISSSIDVRLIAEKDMPWRWISISVIEGKVLLTGYLPKQEQIERAIFICKRIQGVQSVRSEILIGKPPTGELISDVLITADIKRKLFNDKEISGFTVHIQTTAGRVYLRGIVATPLQKQRAATLAAEVKGVTSIVNLLQLKGEK
ncbi:MAG: hypothetical protein COS82_01590 [Zetaproteobacteria bacterium CG06_land_8_20_14_3_00_59_53]|nr:MAG: hypothetical protein AUK36_06330 [Zetaproteobacteria bacterium CG2_30_59_37]PIO90658.1 MAG: hypothetical protein COX56_02640 [Zetaproteobacteria bacterium CG23_combo_of_CG06-09_8_20_14_all_59_86]PIQ66078.1 MAG: hypothetical protein COV97_00315 [Zetaproteobacteria bacterium CG11_big_fil_rev_8_21_14_0_20_59_439]PIU71604.1 MAG: hypothetical protein COS82_01590 [Zetaproteobacteria bacterium CG06_land_8_20_14_3_00_59_53]PIU97866.1 MAG: hypothetical protein COS62_02570 [Zetaproteobacteria bac